MAETVFPKPLDQEVAELNAHLGNLILVKEYNAPNIPVNQDGNTSQFPFANLGLTPPTGYRYLSILPIVTGSNSVGQVVTHIQGYDGLTTDAKVGVVVKSRTTGSFTWSVRLVIYYIRSDVSQA